MLSSLSSLKVSIHITFDLISYFPLLFIKKDAFYTNKSYKSCDIKQKFIMNTTIKSIETSSATAAMDDLRISTAFIGIVIYLGGFIGNFFSFLLFIQKELRQVSTGLLFLLLNIFSTIHLLSLIVEFLDTIFGVEVVPSGVFRCQFILWLQNVTRTVCSFLATTISIDRLLRSEYPLRSRIWCTTKHVAQLSIIYIIFSIILYAFFYYPLNLFDADGNCSFTLNNTFHLFAINVMPAIRFIFICVLPTSIMLACGARMIYNIRQSRKRIAQQTTMQNTTIAKIIIPASKASITTNNQQREKVAIDRMLLLMVIANVFTYIITQIPFNAYTIYYGYETTISYLSYSLTRSFLLMWSSIYFGVGFYLFCIASPQFRKQFITKIQALCICYRPLKRETS